MNPYDEQHYQPPAPIVVLSLRTLGDNTATVSNIVAVIDTGADVTLLPRWAIEQSGLTPVADANVQLEWFDGSSRPAESVELEVTF